MTDAPAAGEISELDADAIFRALVDNGVEFLVIGGLAVAVHGYPRATKDVDVVPGPGLVNAGRLYAALSAIDARLIEIGDFRPDELPVEFSQDGLAFGGNWALHTRHGRVDVMQRVPGIGGYDDLIANAIDVEVRGVGTVRFAGYEDMVVMKQTAGRGQDQEDLERLKEARGEG